ncbi:hypothetical protein [Algibacter mikhailovii]|uniref:Calx-beta domain-containing protein n=1 Tax=Algibacter mikhailovii TaxID=425498 RepID=A0A918QYZ5_9FLAO|nr:hypothetical protein [Algibacter mikhailovii]GGZ79218.1 hypothetical protein GCM10007028_15960 [Algibacter mikhailovii]
MKKIVYIILVALVAGFYSCETDYDAEDQGITLTDLPKYVAFYVAGAGSTIADVDVDAGSDTDDAVNVQIPGGTLSDVTVNYTFSGTAVYGTDYTVDGASSTGGSVTIEYGTTPNVDGLPFNADIVVEALPGASDSTLTITLSSASNAEGEIAVGRGGTDLLKTVNVNITAATP